MTLILLFWMLVKKEKTFNCIIGLWERCERQSVDWILKVLNVALQFHVLYTLYIFKPFIRWSYESKIFLFNHLINLYKNPCLERFLADL